MFSFTDFRSCCMKQNGENVEYGPSQMCWVSELLVFSSAGRLRSVIMWLFCYCSE